MNTQIVPGPNLPSDVSQHAVDRGALESPLIWQALLLGALIMLYLAFRPRRQRPNRGARQVPSLTSRLIPVVAFTMAAGLTYVNSYVGYVRTGHDLAAMLQRGHGWTAQLGHGLATITTIEDSDLAKAHTQLDHADKRPTGIVQAGPPPRRDLRLEKIDIPDPALAVPTGRTNVLLPPGYDDPVNAGRRYPVVYLVHGYPAGSSDDWFTSGDAVGTMKQLMDRKLVAPMILVGVDATAGAVTTDWECLNVPHGPQLDSYLGDFVPQQIDRRYRTVGNRVGRAIGGMSGGGFCALNVGLHHVHTFGTILDALPYDDAGTSKSLLGPDPGLIAANTPRSYLPGFVFTEPVALMLDVGQNATTDVNTARRIAGTFLGKGQKVALRLEPDLNHTWRTARAGLPYLLTFAAEQFPVVGGDRNVN